MTYLDLLNELRKLPVYLLEDEVELWRYEPTGDIETMPIHHLVNPHDDDGDPEWHEGGNYHLSLQSFAEEPEPDKRKFYVDAIMRPSVQFCIEADSVEDAVDKAGKLMWSPRFFDSIKDEFDFDETELFETMTLTDVNECFDNVDPLDVDGFIA